MNWQFVPLGEFAVKRGGSVNPAKYGDETFELLSIPAYDRGTADICLGSEIGSSKKCVKPNDVLLSRIVPHIRRSWVVSESKGCRQIASGEWIQFRSSDFSPGYLRHFFVSDPFHKRFLRTVSGVGGSLLRARPAEVYKIPVPLPPLEEQKRIAKILDTADALRTKRRESLAQLDKLLQSIFLDMFGDPASNPMGWEVSVIGAECGVGTGSTPSRKDPSNYDGTIPWVKSTEINWGSIHKTSESVSSAGCRAARLKKYEPGAVVVALYGQGKTRGKCAVLGVSATMNQACAAIMPSETVGSEYLFGLLKYSYQRLRNEARGGNQENLNLSILKGFAIPLPPVDLQSHFATIAQSIENQKTQQRAHLAELDTLFASLQDRAFSGKL